MSKLLELAKRAEAAKGPDRQLDLAIADALDLPRKRNGSVNISAHVTASLNSARALIPEGWDWSIDYIHGAEFQRAVVSCDPGPYCEGKAIILSLALCAAALKARATQEQPA